jgi:hypothetical protein
MREEIYKAIDKERDYQNLQFVETSSGDGLGNGERSLDEFILYIQAYTSETVKLSLERNTTMQKLHNMRKIAALAVWCMEQHGVLSR